MGLNFDLGGFVLLECARYGVKLTEKACDAFRRSAPERCEGCTGATAVAAVAARADRRVAGESAGQRVHRKDVLKVRVCAVDGCCGVHMARGFCPRHYQQLRRFGRILSEDELAAVRQENVQRRVIGKGKSLQQRKLARQVGL